MLPAPLSGCVMAHEIRIKIDDLGIGNKDLEVHVKARDAEVGTLFICKDRVYWRPTQEPVMGHFLSWKRFAEVMEDYGEPD